MARANSEIEKATAELALAIAEHSKGRLDNLGLISHVLSELMCDIDAYRDAVRRRRQQTARGSRERRRGAQRGAR